MNWRRPSPCVHKGAVLGSEIKRAQELASSFRSIRASGGPTSPTWPTAAPPVAHRAPRLPAICHALTPDGRRRSSSSPRNLRPAGATSSSAARHGDPLYERPAGRRPRRGVCVSTPVGEFRDLLAYLVRRLLENGSNTVVRTPGSGSLGSGRLAGRGRLRAGRRACSRPPQSRVQHCRPDTAVSRPTQSAASTCSMRRRCWPDASDRSRGSDRTPLRDNRRRLECSGWCNNPARRSDIVGTVVDATPMAPAGHRHGLRRYARVGHRGVEERAALIVRVADAWEAAHDSWLR